MKRESIQDKSIHESESREEVGEERQKDIWDRHILSI